MLDAVFADNHHPLTGRAMCDPACDWPFTGIVMRTPTPTGLGKA